MIRQLTGTIANHLKDSVVLDVNGVGYLVRLTTDPNKFTLGSNITLHIHLAVRENALDLYGFELLDELEIFELLITLPKIGPKSAAQILAQADISLLKEAVFNDDATYLSKMSGIGKKSAEKIVAGLKDKLDNDSWTITPSSDTRISPNNHTSDAVDALIALGYQANDARKAVQQIDLETKNANDVVREALRILSTSR